MDNEEGRAGRGRKGKPKMSGIGTAGGGRVRKGHGKARAMTLGLAATLALAGGALAQDSGGEEVDEIVVTATRTERPLSKTVGNVAVIGGSEARDASEADVAAALDDAEGIEVVAYGGPGSASSAHIRGTRGVHTLVLVDGRTQNPPAQGGADISGIASAFVDRIEVVRGPSSALYGTGAVGGLVQILTVDPPDVPWRRSDVAYGSFSTAALSLVAGAPFGPGGGVLGVHGLTTDGHRPNSEADAAEVFAKLRAGADGSEGLTVTLGYRDSAVGWPGPMPAADPADRDESQTAFGNDEVSSLLDHGATARGYVQAELRAGAFRARASLDRLYEEAHQEWMEWVWVDPSYELHHKVQDKSLTTLTPAMDFDASWSPREGVRVLAGASFAYDRLDVSSTDVDLDAPPPIPSSRLDERTTAAAWTQAEFDAGPWQSVAGLRWDEPSDYDGRLSGRAAGAWRNGSGLSVEAAFGTAFRAPALNDLNWPADMWSVGNPDLEPETALEAGVSVKWRAPAERGLRASLSLFQKDIEGMIAWAPDSDGVWTPDNLNDVRIRGVEVAVDAPLGRGLRARAGYSLLDSWEEGPMLTQADSSAFPAPTVYTYTDIRRETAYTPEHQLDLALEWSARAGPGALKASLSASWTSEVLQYYQTWTDIGGNISEITYPTKTLDAHWLVGLRLGWAVGKGEVFVRADNLLDTDYARQFGNTLVDRDNPMPGRSVTFGGRLEF